MGCGEVKKRDVGLFQDLEAPGSPCNERWRYEYFETEPRLSKGSLERPQMRASREGARRGLRIGNVGGRYRRQREGTERGRYARKSLHLAFNVSVAYKSRLHVVNVALLARGLRVVATCPVRPSSILAPPYCNSHHL